jgi:hypothetical protein
MREWWLRTVLVLFSPRAVFVALRKDEPEEWSLRSEPVLLITILAGIVFVLSTKTAAHLEDDNHDYDGAIVAVWTFFAGSLFGGFGYWLLGMLLYIPATALGSQGSFRRTRHVLAFASVPIALAILLVPVKLALYGGDLFHRGGSDAGGGERVFEVIGLALLAWSGCLLLVGVQAVHGWGWGRAAVAALPAAAALGAFLWF